MRRLILLPILGLAMAALVSAQQARPPLPTPPDATGKAVVLGRVVETGTTNGVPGALVILTTVELGTRAVRLGDRPVTVTGPGAQRIIADAQGRFAFRDLAAGSYSILVSATGYVTGYYGQTRPIQIVSSLDVTRPLDLTDADRPATVTVPLWKYSGIGGVVRDELGEPMVGVVVSVITRVTDSGGIVMQPVTSATTDDRGMYHVDVIPGDYVVGVMAATTTFPAAASDAFQRAMTEGGPAQQQYMTQMVAAGGVLPRGFGTRIGNLLVSQINSNNVVGVPPVLAMDGGRAFYPSTYHPASTRAASASIVRVGSGEERAGINLDLKPIAVRRVSGRVMGPATAAANIALRLLPSDANARMSATTQFDTPQAVADGNGNFTFIGIAPGSYRLSVIRLPVTPDESLWWNTDPVAVGDEDITNLQVALQPGVQISGRIQVDSAGAPPAAAAMRTLSITPAPVPGGAAAQQRVGATRADEAGRFTTPPLMPGPYIVLAATLPQGWILKSVTVGGRDAADTPFELTPSGISDMVVTITDRISTLAGTVRDANGQASRSATVGVFPVDKNLWRIPGMSSRRVRVSLPARDGRYSFSGLPAGEYFVVAVDGAPVDFSDPAALTSLINTASRITLADGDTRTQDLSVTMVRGR